MPLAQHQDGEGCHGERPHEDEPGRSEPRPDKPVAEHLVDGNHHVIAPEVVEHQVEQPACDEHHEVVASDGIPPQVFDCVFGLSGHSNHSLSVKLRTLMYWGFPLLISASKYLSIIA